MLRDLQLQLMEALYEDRPDKAASLIAAVKPEARDRLHIYRNNARANCEEALASIYPVVRRLVGEDYFRQLRATFRVRHPSRSGDLQQVGERFPHYVAELHRSGAYRYLGAVAQFEWLIQEVSIAPAASSINLTELAHVGPCEQPRLIFKLHPALRLFRSAYPVLRIWEANLDTSQEPSCLALDAGADRLIILRHASSLQCHRLSEADYLFLLELEQGVAFGAAVEAVLGQFSDWDALEILQRCVALNAIVGFELAMEVP